MVYRKGEEGSQVEEIVVREKDGDFEFGLGPFKGGGREEHPCVILAPGIRYIKIRFVLLHILESASEVRDQSCLPVVDS